MLPAVSGVALWRPLLDGRWCHAACCDGLDEPTLHAAGDLADALERWRGADGDGDGAGAGAGG